MKKSVTTALILASGLAAALQATPARSQTTLAMAANSNPPSKAVELERKAELLYGEPGRYHEAARLLLRAAELREDGDPMQVHDLSMAGRLFYYTGRKAEALRTIESAADAALAIGDVLNAAHLYVDASHLARENGRPDDAVRLMGSARLLTKSPLLAESSRREVTARLAT